MTDQRTERILRQHVMTDRLLGVTTLPVGDAADQPTDAQAGTSATAGEQTKTAASRGNAGTATGGSDSARFAARAAGAAAAASGQALFTSPATDPPSRDTGPMLDSETKLRILQEMDENEVRGCTKCELCRGRTQTVFGEGDPDADLMFIGEGPGQTEDELGRPFVGRAGDKLNEMIKAMKRKREQVFIANVVKCRPPNNRTPTPQEIDACWDYLRRQIETIRPRAIVTLGGPATKMLLNTKRGITSIRGTWHQWDGLLPHGPAIPVMPTFHPAYLLRAYTVENRKKVWSDLQAVMKALDEE